MLHRKNGFPVIGKGMMNYIIYSNMQILFKKNVYILYKIGHHFDIFIIHIVYF